MAFVAAAAAAPLASALRGGAAPLCGRGRARPARAARAPPRAAAPRASAGGDAAAGPALLKRFVRDAGALGTLRFVAVSGGAVLETIGRFDYGVREFSVPGKGDFLTVASEDRTFECHINASKVARVTLTDEPAKLAAGHTLHVVRFLGGDGAPVLSVLLMWAPNDGPGHYLHGAVDAFRALRDRYGGDFSL